MERKKSFKYEISQYETPSKPNESEISDLLQKYDYLTEKQIKGLARSQILSGLKVKKRKHNEDFTSHVLTKGLSNKIEQLEGELQDKNY